MFYNVPFKQVAVPKIDQRIIWQEGGKEIAGTVISIDGEKCIARDIDGGINEISIHKITMMEFE